MANYCFNPKTKTKLANLAALTSAALLLPGLITPSAEAADDDSVDFQYSHYQESKRDIYGSLTDSVTQQQLSPTKLPNNLHPIEVDTLRGSSRVTLSDRVKFAFNYTQDTWSGATPVGTAPAIANRNDAIYKNVDPTSGIVIGASPYASSDHLPMFFIGGGNVYLAAIDNMTGSLTPGLKNNKLTHVMSMASPETRKQGDFKLSYEWDEAALEVGGGISVENDYESRFGSFGGRMDFNEKQTAVNVGVSYTNSDTFASLDPDSLTFINTADYDNSFVDFDPNGKLIVKSQASSVGAGVVENAWAINQDTGEVSKDSAMLKGNRQDWGTQLGLTQVLNKDATMQLGFGYTRSTGYLGNPYKLVYVFNAELTPDQDPRQPFLVTGGGGRLEVRPGERNQFNWSIGLNQYLQPFDAALHFDYKLAHDDWGINAHTFEADWVQPLGTGWSVTPRIRYYSQSKADFYVPYLTQVQVIDPNTGLPMASPLNKALPKNYSSDQRLSGFGALSGGLTIAKQFAKGVQFETGFEYYTHQGSLKLGGGGEAGFADYDFWSVNAALKVNLDALGSLGNHSGHTNSSHHQHSDATAGLMFGHTLDKPGDFMVGYRYMRSEQAGNILLGTQAAALDTVAANGCGGQECQVVPKTMTMNMHMLDLMYAPTDWLTLMLMPQWMDMDMVLQPLAHHEQEGIEGHNHGGAVHNHQAGGVGDTGLYALFKLFDRPNHHIILSLGGTAPTGDAGILIRKTHTNLSYDTFIHYGMQLGSGTWDFKPSLTYSGGSDNLLWGAQATGTIRLENKNSSGFAFGDIFQGSLWGGYRWTNWLATTVRGVYTWQDALRGQYKLGTDYRTGEPYAPTHIGPFDQPGNYGGQYVDLGLGINVTIPDGAFAGNRLAFEWLQPIHTDVNGHQLDRDGALSFTWNYGF
ncbi:MAG: DUF3570 domain-containing protein [Methyloglobulus sp.]|nr:DUF3570 domain-containing protein [Methyloglobulus sp.]